MENGTIIQVKMYEALNSGKPTDINEVLKVINRIIEIFGKQEKPDEYYVEVYRNSVNDFVRGIMTGVLQELYKKPGYIIPPSCVKRYDDRVEVALNLHKVKEV